jgi:hypothetical protein
MDFAPPGRRTPRSDPVWSTPSSATPTRPGRLEALVAWYLTRYAAAVGREPSDRPGLIQPSASPSAPSPLAAMGSRASAVLASVFSMCFVWRITICGCGSPAPPLKRWATVRGDPPRGDFRRGREMESAPSAISFSSPHNPGRHVWSEAEHAPSSISPPRITSTSCRTNPRRTSSRARSASRGLAAFPGRGADRSLSARTDFNLQACI